MTPASDWTDRTVQRYRILEKIGEGGMGVVYKAEDTRLERIVALKFLAPNLQQNAESRKRLEREAKAAAALQHSNICTVYEIGEHEGQLFIAMAYIAGSGLDSRIAAGPLKLEDALEIARQAADGLAEAHRSGVVHRDIKPANLMLSGQPGEPPRVVITDFGLAQLAQVSRLTAAATAIGTVAYMSPEQTYGGAVDHRSDLWSLGVVLYEMLAGRPPFRGHYDKAVMYAITEEEPEPLTGLRSGLPIEIDWVVGKSLAKDPAERYQSASEMAIDLTTLLRKLRAGSTRMAAPALAARSAAPTADVSAAGLAESRRPDWTAGLGWAAAAALAAGWAYSALFGDPAPALPPLTPVRQITYDRGLSFQPALAPGGSMVAFSSDRADEGELDIWLLNLSGGEPLRLTDHPADDTEPVFTPDGNRIVFRSERDGGGLYIMPALGGPQRLLAPHGRGARFSPDGRTLAYWVGESSSRFTGDIYLLSLDGGGPVEWQPEMEVARAPVWLPDGRRIVFAGRDASGRSGWWIGAVAGGRARPVEPFAALSSLPLSWEPYPEAVRGAEILFALASGGASSLWSLALDRKGEPRGFRALTAGAGYAEHPSASADGAIAFSLLERDTDVWETPLRPDGRPAGPPRRVTTHSSLDTSPSASRDGRLIAFESNRAGSGDIWLRDLAAGSETLLTISKARDGLPRLSRDGRMIAYRRTENGRPSVMIAAVGGAAARTVCEDCTGPYDWSPDLRGVLARPAANNSIIELVSIESGERRTLLEKPSGVLYDPRFSPDGRWIAFHSLESETTRRIYLAPFHADRATGPDEWIPLTDGREMDRNVEWSADGRVLYFLSERTGNRCIWGQTMDLDAGRPLGEAFSVVDLSRPSASLSGAGFGFSAASGRLFFGVASTRGNVWLIDDRPNE